MPDNDVSGTNIGIRIGAGIDLGNYNTSTTDDDNKTLYKLFGDIGLRFKLSDDVYFSVLASKQYYYLPNVGEESFWMPKGVIGFKAGERDFIELSVAKNDDYGLYGASYVIKLFDQLGVSVDLKYFDIKQKNSPLISAESTAMLGMGIAYNLPL